MKIVATLAVFNIYTNEKAVLILACKLRRNVDIGMIEPVVDCGFQVDSLVRSLLKR